MSAAHRDGDARVCGATTVVGGQGSVYVNGKLWAVDGDPNSHGAGNLIGAGTVFVEGKLVIVDAPDSAVIDLLMHPNPATAGGSGDTFSGV